MKAKKTKEIPRFTDGLPRVPRPLGTTQRAQAYQITQDQKTKERIKEELIQFTIDQYINNGMIICGKLMSIEDLARLLSLPVERLLLRINRGLTKIMGVMKGEDGRQLARVLIFSAIQKGLEYQAHTENHALNLVHLQQGRYVPFLTKDATKALKVMVDSQKPILDIIKLMGDFTSTPVNKGVGQDNTDIPEGKYLTTDTALKYIQDRDKSILEDDGLLEQKVNTLEQVEVRANYQDLTRIGIKEVRPNERALTAHSTPMVVPSGPSGHHENYREMSQEIDEILDAEDFQA